MPKAKSRIRKAVRKATRLTRAQLEERVIVLKESLEDDTALRNRMSDILRRTANALHGGPLDNGYWSWHNLPELAQTLHDELEEMQFLYSDRVPYSWGWWWRVPYGWWLRAVKFIKTGD